ncbi:hypothetical protein GX586_04865, partial [bacterium]|nr:hypothetical protein [bacterium]
NVTSLLDVKGMTADLFGRICNEVTTRSDQFRLLIVAQALQDLDRDGVFNEAAGDRILAHAARDVVVDRSPLTDADTREARFTVSIRE